MKSKLLVVLLALAIVGCTEDPPPPPSAPTPAPEPVPNSYFEAITTFNADSAYRFVQEQVDFGPRVPNTATHLACAEYLKNKLIQYGFEVQVQKAVVTAYNGTTLNIQNIIGQINPENSNRILLFAHWDTRPYADKDTQNKSQPIDGANDGASGVGVLLEIARQLSLDTNQLAHGIDIIFFDGEDYGQPENSMVQEQYHTYCLGSQYWANNKMPANYTAKFGILLDMVGGPNALFTKEAISMTYAEPVMNKTWSIAQQLEYGNYFSNQRTQFLGADDHLYVNELANIPSIDIIQYNPATGGFADYHHTHADNMETIDKSTLNAVGHTVLETIYRAK